MRTRAIVATIVSLTVVAAVSGYLRQLGDDIELPLAMPAPGCTVQGAAQDNPAGPTRRLTLGADQMANAATIAAVGIRQDMPEQAIVVALATAFQESGLENLPGGDRDSVGLFQQRPSQGWGTVKEIRDPRYAAKRFYNALKKVRGWESMRVTDAAQAVQRSAFPGAYQKWADESLVLANALVGNTTGAVTCTVTGNPAKRGGEAAAALTAGLLLDWGRVETATPAELPGLTVAAATAQVGWRYAHWLVSHAGDHGVKRVRFGGLQWTADEGAWTPVADSEADHAVVVAEVFADA